MSSAGWIEQIGQKSPGLRAKAEIEGQIKQNAPKANSDEHSQKIIDLVPIPALFPGARKGIGA